MPNQVKPRRRDMLRLKSAVMGYLFEKAQDPDRQRSILERIHQPNHPGPGPEQREPQR